MLVWGERERHESKETLPFTVARIVDDRHYDCVDKSKPSHGWDKNTRYWTVISATVGTGQDEMGWDGMGWNGMGWDCDMVLTWLRYQFASAQVFEQFNLAVLVGIHFSDDLICLLELTSQLGSSSLCNHNFSVR